MIVLQFAFSFYYCQSLRTTSSCFEVSSRTIFPANRNRSECSVEIPLLRLSFTASSVLKDPLSWSPITPLTKHPLRLSMAEQESKPWCHRCAQFGLYFCDLTISSEADCSQCEASGKRCAPKKNPKLGPNSKHIQSYDQEIQSHGSFEAARSATLNASKSREERIQFCRLFLFCRSLGPTYPADVESRLVPHADRYDDEEDIVRQDSANTTHKQRKVLIHRTLRSLRRAVSVNREDLVMRLIAHVDNFTLDYAMRHNAERDEGLERKILELKEAGSAWEKAEIFKLIGHVEQLFGAFASKIEA